MGGHDLFDGDMFGVMCDYKRYITKEQLINKLKPLVNPLVLSSQAVSPTPK